MQSSSFVIIIFGPTGVGKSDIAQSLASFLPIEIINMDVGQFYAPLSIGTAKPAWQQSSIPHHLFDIIAEPKNITVAEYRDLVIDQVRTVWQHKKIPVLVGGSGFYLMSLFFPPEAAKTDQVTQGTWQDLNELDPARAAKIHPQDIYRIQRALSIIKTTGRLPSVYQPHFDPIAPFIITELVRERQDLYDRINGRTKVMMQLGWQNEVEKLLNTEWELYLQQKKLIGYDDIISYLKSEEDKRNYDQLIATIAQKTRHYAKRQLTFGRMLIARLKEQYAFMQSSKSSVEVFNLTLSDVDLYINQLLHHPLVVNYQGKKE